MKECYKQYLLTFKPKPMALNEKLNKILNNHPQIFNNPARKFLIAQAVDNREALIDKTGSLVTWTPPESTGRSPKDTYYVKRPASQNKIDWTSPNSNALKPEIFNDLFNEALDKIYKKSKIYIADRVIGSVTKYALPVRVISDRAVTTLFVDNMFKPVPADIKESVFFNQGFVVLALPYDKVEVNKYGDKLRKEGEQTSTMVIAMDLDRRLGLVYGSAYCGSIKKMLFTVMDYYLPDIGVLPLHCGANEDKDGKVALFLGLSGTGKTTLTTDPKRK